MLLTILLFQIPDGIGFVISNLVGNSIGEMNSTMTKKYVKAAIILALWTSVIVIIALFLFKHYIAMAFTMEEEVNILIESVIPIFSIWVLFDYSQCVVWAAIRGMGYQIYGSVVSLITKIY